MEFSKYIQLSRSRWFLTLLLFIACTAVLSQAFAQHYETIEILDIPYYTGIDSDPDKHKLDLYLPFGIRNYPTLLWIHGGAWREGGRKQEAELARRFAERGLGMIVISYRLSPGLPNNLNSSTGVRHPEHIRDCVRALKWVLNEGSLYEIDTQKIIISGYSSGAHLAALVATDLSYLSQAGLGQSALLGAIPIAGAYDLVDYYRSLIKNMGAEEAEHDFFGLFVDIETAKKASPSKHLDASKIPMLVVSELSTYRYAKSYEELLAKAGNKHVEFFHDRARNHQTLYKGLIGKEECDTRNKIISYALSLSKE